MFSWALARIMLPGWYGFGSGGGGTGAQPRAGGHGACCARCTAHWPFFRTLLSNMDMVLAKSDIDIASRYAELVPTRSCARRIFGRIQAEMAAHDRVAARDHRPARSCSRATRRWRAASATGAPYIDPLNHLQVESLRRFRAGEHDDKTKRAILLTINGIAAGLAQQRLIRGNCVCLERQHIVLVHWT